VATDYLTPEQTSALLAAYGYPVAPATEYTAQLRDAVQAFQRDLGTNDSGVVNQHPAKQLRARPTIIYPDERVQVRVFQQAMNARGYRLRVDGVFGQLAHAALMDYQGAVAITRTGVIDAETWGALGCLETDADASS
jgi:peptidoglycan hydrolase-like protein with peptidoglycan-binding domain